MLPSNNPFKAFFQGMGMISQGANFLLKHPRLWILIIVPLAVNLLLFALALGWGYSAFSEMLKSFYEGREQTAWYWNGLILMVRIFFWILALILVYYIFTPVALVIASPFNDILAEKTERTCGMGIEESRPGFRRMVRDAGFAILSELKRMFLFLFVFLLLLLLNIVPVIGNILYLILSVFWAWFCFAFEFTSYTADRRRMGFRQKMEYLGRHPAFFMGFGCMAFLLFMIPFVNVPAMFLCAISGSLAFCAAKRESAVQ